MIPIFEPSLGGGERAYLLECVDTGWISSRGRFIAAFEDAFAGRHGMAHGIACSNCTAALHLALAALGIGPGDEVLCPDLSFVAPANMIALTGATAVLVDVEPDSLAIDPERMREMITPATRAVIVVHPFGHAADMDPIMAIARDHGLRVIEDTAEAPGAAYRDRLLGTIGDVSCFSFYANKILTTGEGGMVLCNDAALDQALRIHRDHGMSRDHRYRVAAPGHNYRMTNMQAAIGLAQLERFDAILARRADQAAQYRHRLAEAPCAKWRKTLPWCTPVHWLATITLEDPAARDPLLDHLGRNGIDARQMIFPVHEAVHLRARFDESAFPVATAVSYRSLHLPSGTELGSEDIDRVSDVVLAWLARNG